MESGTISENTPPFLLRFFLQRSAATTYESILWRGAATPEMICVVTDFLWRSQLLLQYSWELSGECSGLDYKWGKGRSLFATAVLKVCFRPCEFAL